MSARRSWSGAQEGDRSETRAAPRRSAGVSPHASADSAETVFASRRKKSKIADRTVAERGVAEARRAEVMVISCREEEFTSFRKRLLCVQAQRCTLAIKGGTRPAAS